VWWRGVDGGLTGEWERVFCLGGGRTAGVPRAYPATHLLSAAFSETLTSSSLSEAIAAAATARGDNEREREGLRRRRQRRRAQHRRVRTHARTAQTQCACCATDAGVATTSAAGGDGGARRPAGSALEASPREKGRGRGCERNRKAAVRSRWFSRGTTRPKSLARGCDLKRKATSGRRGRM